MVEPKDYLTVTTLTQYLKRKFDLDPYLSRVYLTGEISNFRLRPAHQYFSLKDDHAKISVVMFKGAFEKLKFTPEEGMKVLVTGRVTLYEASGNYQIVIDHMEPNGVGAFYQAFEQLKEKLGKEGLFTKNQRTLVPYPRRVAVITSPSGAVIHDIMTTVARRYPLVQLTLFPAQVQGDTAAASIVQQLDRVKADGGFDALIIGRGGGSIEDLWPFNEEVVARALADMPMPIVSSVGHETDTTIADFVADQRAATPTAAAELVTPNTLVDTVNHIHDLQLRLTNALTTQVANLREQLQRVASSVVLTQPNRLYDQYVQTVDQDRQRLNQAIQTRLREATQRLALARTQIEPQRLQVRIATAQQTVETDQAKLQFAMTARLTGLKQTLQAAIDGLDHLGPANILGRGYAYVTGTDGRMLKRVADFVPGQAAAIHVQDGAVAVTVDQPNKSKR